MLDVLIIGAGPVGLYAGFSAGLRKLNAAVIESLPYVGGQLTSLYPEKPIYDIPGFKEVKAKDFIETLEEQYNQFKDVVPLHLMTQVTNIKKVEDHFVVETTKQTFETKTVLISNGGGTFSPRLLEVENADKPNVLYSVKTFEQFKDKKILVLGGGDSALDWAIALAGVSKNVILSHRRKEFRAHDTSIEKFKTLGKILTPYTVEKVLGDKLANQVVLKNVESNEELTLDVDYVLVNYGLLTSKNTYGDWGLELENNLVKVNSKYRTNIEGIYAVGNCCQYDGKLKMICPGLGEAATAIGDINNYLNPGKNNNVYSSALMHKDK